MEIFVRVLRAEGQVLVAACDKELAGKTLKEGRLNLDVKKDFYCGELRDVKDLSCLLSGASIANLVGNGVVDEAISEGYVDKENVLVIGGVKHAQFMIV